MPRSNVIVVALTLLLAGCGGIHRPTAELDTTGPGDGPGSGYQCYVWTEARQIPDGDHRGILMGPIGTNADAAKLGPITLRLAIRHPAPGDLDIRLMYDSDADGQPETCAPVEFFRSRLEDRAEELHACPGSLDGCYIFKDGTDTEEAVFAVFNELPRGHAFYLSVADTLAEDKGSVLNWAVYTQDPGPLAMR